MLLRLSASGEANNGYIILKKVLPKNYAGGIVIQSVTAARYFCSWGAGK